MKRLTIIASTVIITFTLTAFTYSNRNGTPTNKPSCQATKEIAPPSFFYNLSSYAINTISKEKIHNAITISDLIPEYTIQEDLNNNITSLRDVKIRVEEEGALCTGPMSEKGNGNSLCHEQINLLKTSDYSATFFLEGYLTNYDSEGGSNYDRYFNYNMTVVPEHQATYKAGNESFIDYLTTECQATIAKVQSGNLKSGKISFIVNKKGGISNLDINSTCGYPSVDERMIELMNNLPNAWNVATNGKGEKVNQTLVFSYGLGGC